MKVEIAESLMRSWLRHSMNCQVAELNWKPSANWPELNNPQLLMDKAQTHFLEKHGIDVFGGTKLATQLIKQAEIDVLGIKFSPGGRLEIYAVDVAFHEAGLNYGGHGENGRRILKKLLRSLMVVQLYFGECAVYLTFASPAVGSATLVPIIQAIGHLREFLAASFPQCQIDFFANDDFQEHILAPTLAASQSVADTSELFIRSHQLLERFSDKTSKTATRLDHLNKESEGAESDGKAAARPLEIELSPPNEYDFKMALLDKKRAHIEVHYENGTMKSRDWNVTQFSRSSSVLGNLRSRPEFRQGAWQKNKIRRIVVKVAA